MGLITGLDPTALLIDLLQFKPTEPSLIKIFSQPDNSGCLATFSGECEKLWIGCHTSALCNKIWMVSGCAAYKNIMFPALS